MDQETGEGYIRDFRKDLENDGLTQELAGRFREVIYGYYREHRRNFPWRETASSRLAQYGFSVLF